eukprot:Nitzschia sp. Nitz4//scaffold349_size16934//14462//15593//NITZ4_008850-RA/size16934-snap-gene-0.3-mRNA-1//-1//CDS//3329548713//8034//frame0
MSDSYSYTPSKLIGSFETLLAAEQAKVAAAAPFSSASSSGSTGGSFVAAAVQFTAAGMESSSVDSFWAMAQEIVPKAAKEHGANLILLPELFLGPYFCQSQEAVLMDLACDDVEGSCFIVRRMQELAKEHKVVLPVSVYERANNTLFNTVVMIDSDGSILGKYRKSHIPDGTGYQEKFYFSPGDTGFRVWDTSVGKVGVAICWDQWFPEGARAMALQGADVLLYPTAIGSEPQDPTINSADHWQRTMQGHAAANMVPVVASNRYGTEILLNEDGTEKQRITFYGRSFIADETGALVQHATEGNDSNKPYTIMTHTIDPVENRKTRLAWGLFRDRRPELYGVLLTKDGKAKN